MYTVCVLLLFFVAWFRLILSVSFRITNIKQPWRMRVIISDESTRFGGIHDDVIKWKHFPRNWPFVRGIHRSPVNSPHKGQWRGALMFTLICARINVWVNTREAGDLRRYCPHYDVTVMTHAKQTTIRPCAYVAGHNAGIIFWHTWSLHWPHNERHGVSNHQGPVSI